MSGVWRERGPRAHYFVSQYADMHALVGDLVVPDGVSAAADGLITVEQADMLVTGRKIRNGMAHGQTTHTAMPPAMAVPMVRTSFRIVAEPCAAAPAAPPP